MLFEKDVGPIPAEPSRHTWGAEGVARSQPNGVPESGFPQQLALFTSEPNIASITVDDPPGQFPKLSEIFLDGMIDITLGI